jgi:hypothetical protein
MPPHAPAAERADLGSGTILGFYGLVASCVPEAYRPAALGDDIGIADTRWVADSWPAFATPVRRFLAAKAFGSWLAYQGRGVRTLAFSLEVALSVLRLNCAAQCEAAARPLDRALFIEAVRRTDELLVHLASREALARALSRVEGG